MSVISLNGVSLALGGRDVLREVTLDFAAREFVGVLGPNGAGKTTLMRAVLGLVAPSRGTIHVFGEPAARGNPAIGYLPQTRAPLGGLRFSGEDFVASALNGHRFGLPVSGRAARREVARVLDLVGGRELARRPLSETSGGERQRLLLAQALLGSPRALLLDEPLISLDPHHQSAAVALTKTLQETLGILVLFTAHELNPLLRAMDRVLYLGGGQAALGTVDEVITGEVLSRLYGSEIEVMRIGGRVFVMAGDYDLERDDHGHGHAHD